MIQIEFVHYTETKNGTSYHTVSELKSVRVDPQSVKGIDYHSIESRKAKFSFYDDSSFFSTYFLTNWSFIPDMKYNIFAIRLTKDGTTEYIGYVKPDNVIYDIKTKMVTISATDILGVLLDLAGTDNDYDEGNYNIKTLLENEITDILDGYDVNYIDNSDEISYTATDERIRYDNEKKFLKVAGENGLTIDGYDAYARIRSVLWDGEKYNIILCDYDRDRLLSGDYYERLKWCIFEIEENLFISNYTYVTNNYLNNNPADELWNNWLNDFGGTETSNQSDTGLDSTMSFGDDSDGTKLYFTGDISIDEIEIEPDLDENYKTINRKRVISALLILMNAEIRIEKDGDITVEDKDFIGTGTNIDTYTLENKKGFILHSEKDFESNFDFIVGVSNIARIITIYYNNLFETFKYEYNLSVNSDANLSLGDTITSDGKDMRIVEIDEPYNENIYYIKAWGE